MQAFRVYFKIMRSSVPWLALSLTVFVCLAIFFSAVAPTKTSSAFEPHRIPIAIVNRDQGGTISRALEEYLGSLAQVVPYPDDEEKLQDALFFRNVEYIALIPEGFSHAFSKGTVLPIGKVVVPASTSSYYMDMAIDSFLGALGLHLRHDKGTVEEMIASTRDELSLRTKVKVDSQDKGVASPGHSYYFAYCSYALVLMVMSGVSSVMLSWNQPDVSQRNSCSPTPRRQAHLGLFFGHCLFSIFCWAILLLVAVLIYGQGLLGSGILGLYALNTLTYAAICAALGLLLGGTVRGTGGQMGAVNVTALGLSFLGGVFIPQEIMSKGVLSVAKFLPSYWYIKANRAIGDFAQIGAMKGYIAIQIAFAIAILAVALFLGKERSARSLS